MFGFVRDAENMKAGAKLPLGKLRAIKKDPKLGREFDKITAARHNVPQGMIVAIRNEIGVMSYSERAAQQRMADIADVCDAHDDGVIDLAKHTVNDVNRILDKRYSGSLVKMARRTCGVSFQQRIGTTKKKVEPYSDISEFINGWGR